MNRSCSKSRKPAFMNEFDFISRIKKSVSFTHASLVQGIGDDAAVISLSADRDQLVSTDVSVEGVHFSRSYFSAEEIGRRAVNVALSDIAAMGGKADFALVSVGLPRDVTDGYALEIMAGVGDALQAAGACLCGGDTSRSPGLFLDVVVIGHVEKGRAVLRSGAHAGDVIAVSGTLGSSALGLKQLQAGESVYSAFVQKHKKPVPRFDVISCLQQEGIWPSAMIDVSDGFVQDLEHILRASGNLAAEIIYKDLPRVRDFCLQCKKMGLSEEQMILGGGEDYELLMTFSDDAWKRLGEGTLKEMTLTKIGRVGDQVTHGGSLVQVKDEHGCLMLVPSGGYVHF